MEYCDQHARSPRNIHTFSLIPAASKGLASWFFLCSSVCFGQITVTSPATTDTLMPADEYASQILQDPWDMNERTDIGWYTEGVDQPYSNLTNLSFSGGIFSSLSNSAANPNFWLLDTANPTAAPIGKTGANFRIDSTKYRRLLLRMNLSGGGISTTPTASQSAQVLWSNNTIYNGINTSTGIWTYPGWWIYSVDLPTIGVSVGTPWSAASVDSLRFDPLSIAGVTIQVDWARLVANDSTLYRNITWTGSGNVDIFLDNDNNWSNGYIGQIAINVPCCTYNFYPGGLPAGTYKVAIRPTGSSGTPAYSPGAYQVAGIPRVAFTSPSPEGSADDFATVQLGDPWDMTSMLDIDATFGVTNPTITNITAETDAGTQLGSVPVMYGTSVQAPPGQYGDDEAYFFAWWDRGYNYRIDASRYHILTFQLGVAGDRDIANGSIARVVWRRNGDSVENQSAPIILNHRSGANVIEKIILDMQTLLIDPASPTNTGWNGQVDGFRMNAHEFASPRDFWFHSVKLSANERANASYTIQWQYTSEDTSTSPTMNVYWSASNGSYSGTLIASAINPAAGQYVWNTSVLPNGTYYIYTTLNVNGRVINQNYARWPIVIDHSYVPLPSINVNRPLVTFGATQNGAVVTASQPVQLSVTGNGPVSWTATTNRSYLMVSPSSGTGSGTINISINSNTLPSPSSADGTVTITALGVNNSPQYVRMSINVENPGSTTPPFGYVDQPANGASGVSGAFSVTGWALDDIEVTSTQVWRKPVPGETPSSNGLIYIGDGFFLQGTRPDVQLAYPNYPLNDRAGWGMGILSNMLPNSSGSGPSGNGTYQLTIIANDREGSSTVIGTPTITVNNTTATLPFGTIDTPASAAVISGSNYTVFGWALTPQPAIIPIDGSTIWVFVDGVSLGHPVYNQYRSDIATLFPGYQNSNGAVGFFYLDTTKLANGMHSIAWSVTDNLNRIQGIGNRVFYVQN